MCVSRNRRYRISCMIHNWASSFPSLFSAVTVCTRTGAQESEGSYQKMTREESLRLVPYTWWHACESFGKAPSCGRRTYHSLSPALVPPLPCAGVHLIYESTTTRDFHNSQFPINGDRHLFKMYVYNLHDPGSVSIRFHAFPSNYQFCHNPNSRLMTMSTHLLEPSPRYAVLERTR